MAAIKVIKVLGTSEESWEEAAHEAVREASETVLEVHGVDIEKWSAKIEGGEIVEYRATTEIAFPVEH